MSRVSMATSKFLNIYFSLILYFNLHLCSWSPRIAFSCGKKHKNQDQEQVFDKNNLRHVIGIVKYT
jgi:hypothetical protein